MKIASGSITTANLTINFTDKSINASGLSVPANDQEGLSEFSKSLTITNETIIDGQVKLTLTRASGLALNDLRYIIEFNLTGYKYVKNNYFGTSVTKNGTNYTLQNIIELENYNNLDSLATHHYTCVNAGLTECEKVAYIYYIRSDQAYYILLEDDAMSIEDAINKMQINTKDSTIKAVIDNWFKTNLTNEINANISNYQTYIEDTIYCNEQRMNTLGTDQTKINNGWIANGGGMNNELYYLGYGRSN